MDLDKIMAIDHVIIVDEDGNVTDAQNVWAPEVYVDTDENGQILNEHEIEMVDSVRSQGWKLLTGYTGQWMYSGPIMHSSEFIGGALADDILAIPGTYVAVSVETLDDGEDAAGWAVARLNS